MAEEIKLTVLGKRLAPPNPFKPSQYRKVARYTRHATPKSSRRRLQAAFPGYNFLQILGDSDKKHVMGVVQGPADAGYVVAVLLDQGQRAFSLMFPAEEPELPLAQYGYGWEHLVPYNLFQLLSVAEGFSRLPGTWVAVLNDFRRTQIVMEQCEATSVTFAGCDSWGTPRWTFCVKTTGIKGYPHFFAATHALTHQYQVRDFLLYEARAGSKNGTSWMAVQLGLLVDIEPNTRKAIERLTEASKKDYEVYQQRLLSEEKVFTREEELAVRVEIIDGINQAGHVGLLRRSVHSRVKEMPPQDLNSLETCAQRAECMRKLVEEFGNLRCYVGDDSFCATDRCGDEEDEDSD